MRENEKRPPERSLCILFLWHITKDGYLVFNHDNYIDETCDINGDIPLEEVQKRCEDPKNRHYISNMTLAELRQYNFGYYFEDENGQRIYKDVENFAEIGRAHV